MLTIAAETESATAHTFTLRVNVGGGLLSAGPDWQADTASAPSPYVNAVDTCHHTISTTTIDLSHPSVL